MERPVVQVEREEPGSKEPGPTDRVGCLPHRLGNGMRTLTDRGSLVAHRDRLPYKLSGTASSHASSQDVFEGTNKQMHTPVDRQSNSSSVHKQLGRDSLRPSDNHGKGPLDLVPRERDTGYCPIPPGRGKHQSRHRVTSDGRSLRLDAESATLPTDPETVPGVGDRSIRVSSVLPTSRILQLEAGPSS